MAHHPVRGVHDPQGRDARNSAEHVDAHLADAGDPPTDATGIRRRAAQAAFALMTEAASTHRIVPEWTRDEANGLIL
jgi:hypothetical protein